ncbi:MAG: hypothetical protein ACKVP0_24965, partial [Pirellulaceae bacterium]
IIFSHKEDAFALGLFALSDAAVLKLMEVFRPEHWGAFWVYLTAGGMCAQLGILTIWGVVGLGRAWHRQLLVMSIGGLWIGAWVAGRFLLKERGFSPSWKETAPAFCLPLVLLAMQVPLWVFRILARWRLVSGDGSATSKPPQMTIAGILGAMTLVGIALALVKLGLQVVQSHEATFWWTAVAVACASGGIITLFVLVPIIILLLRPKSWTTGLLLSVLFLLGIVTIGVFTTAAFTGNIRSLGFRTYVAFPAAFGGLAGGLLLPLVLIRLANYRLRWGRE